MQVVEPPAHPPLMQATGPVVVAMEGVRRTFGRVEAVKDVSFTLSAGETVALIGHNGAGKTTLMKLMLGLIRPTAGEVRVMGADPASRAFAARNALGFVPEHLGFNGALTGRETLAFYARLKGQARGTIATLLERVGLSHAADRAVSTYSKGMRQRLGLAQALLGEPRLLLLDEPTTGLDPQLRRQLYEIVEELRESGACVLLSSHALTELEGRAGRIIIMDGGIKVADGTLGLLRDMARLPDRLRLRLAHPGETRLPDWLARLYPAHIDRETLEVVVPAGRKLELLRLASAETGLLRDIDIVPPSLDDLYAHFRGETVAHTRISSGAVR
jgi:Cu-processing system ATP-binding protein